MGIGILRRPWSDLRPRQTETARVQEHANGISCVQTVVQDQRGVDLATTKRSPRPKVKYMRLMSPALDVLRHDPAFELSWWSLRKHAVQDAHAAESVSPKPDRPENDDCPVHFAPRRGPRDRREEQGR